jgi:outer membrane protein W
MKKLAAFAFCLFLAPSAWAQKTELALLGGFTSPADLENRAREIEDLKLSSGVTLGGALTRFFSPHLGAEISFAHQKSAIRLTTATDEADLFEVGIGRLQGSLVYRFGAEGARIRPFLSGGLGATFLGSAYLESETKLAWSIGAGLRWFAGEKTGLSLHARYNPTWLNDADSDYCDPFGFCQDSLKQFELLGGLVLRF